MTKAARNRNQLPGTKLKGTAKRQSSSKITPPSPDRGPKGKTPTPGKKTRQGPNKEKPGKKELKKLSFRLERGLVIYETNQGRKVYTPTQLFQQSSKSERRKTRKEMVKMGHRDLVLKNL